KQTDSNKHTNNTDTATGAASKHTSDTGTQFSGSQTGLFTAYAKVVGDVNGDGKVNIVDMSMVGSTFGSKLGDPRYNPAADLNQDGRIDISDMSIVGSNFGS